jgi:hypothetical protein
MEKSISRNSISSWVSLVCAFWFLITSWIWVYYFNLILSFPVGLLAFYLWNRSEKRTIDRITVSFLAAGSLISLVTLYLLK